MSELSLVKNINAHYFWIKLFLFITLITTLFAVWFVSWQWALTSVLFFVFTLLFNRSLNYFIGEQKKIEKRFRAVQKK